MDYSKLRVIRAHREICIPEELYSLRKEIIKVNNRTCVVVHAEKKYVPYIENVIDNIKKVMEDYNIDVRTLSGTVKPQNSNFQTILKMLKNCIFAIVILDGLRPNVVLEYGILLSLEKPIIVLKENNAYFNIRGLNTKLKDDLEENHINDPKLDIDSHLSDVKDLHWTLYDWQTPDNFKKTLQKELVKIKDSVLSQVTKTMISEDVKNLSPDEYYKIQSAFSELAQYVIKFITPSYPKVKEIERKLNFLVEEYKIKLNPEYYLELGKVYYNISKYQDALEIFCKVLNETSPNTDRLYIKGITFYYLNRYNEALEVFNQALINNSDDADVWYIKGIILFYLHRHQEAIEALNKATILSPYNADVWHSKGSNLVLLNRCQEALKAFDQAIKLNPDNADFWNIKGLTNLVLGNHEEALKAFDQAIKLNPDNADFWYNKGESLFYLDRYEEELEAYNQSIKINPRSAKVWYTKGIALALLNRCQEALKAFDQAIKLNPDNADFWNIKGLTNLVLGNHEEALSSYKKELNINPNNAESWYNRALIYTDKDNKELGLKELSIAIELDNSYKQKAKKDNNFKKLWEDEDFKNIVS